MLVKLPVPTSANCVATGLVLLTASLHHETHLPDDTQPFELPNVRYFQASTVVQTTVMPAWAMDQGPW